jgi:hypothetical protein
MYTQPLIEGLINIAAPLVGWTAAVIMAAILLKRRGGRAERWLLIGASVKLFRALAQILSPALITWLTAEIGLTDTQAAQVLLIYQLAGEGTGLVGIIILVGAFWIKFMSREGGQNPS